MVPSCWALGWLFPAFPRQFPEGCKIDELGYENIAQPTRGGNRFDGWWTTQDESGIELTGEETYEELKKYEDADHNIFIYAHWVSNGALELKFDSSFRKTQKLSGVFLNGGALVGAATVTMTKKNENKAMLELSYNYRDGRIKGTFMLYQTGVANYGPSTGHSRKPMLKKFSAAVKGLVIDERFWGMATIKRPTAAKFFAQME